MAAALAAVKQEFGADAVILGTRDASGGLGGLVGRREIEITAAPPATAVAGKPTSRDAKRAVPAADAPRNTGGTGISPVNPQAGRLCHPAKDMVSAYQWPSAIPTGGNADQREALYTQLVQNDVADELARRLVAQAAQNARVTGAADNTSLTQTVREFIQRMLPTVGGLQLEPGDTRRMALVGPPGGGKTTTLAKLAANFKLRRKKEVVILSLDMHRLAAHEQLQRYGQLVGVPVYTAQTVAEVKQRLGEIGAVDLILIDTPGVGLRDDGRFARLGALLRACRPHEVHLVAPASLTPTTQERIAQSFAALGVSRVVLTHLDDAIGLGVILNVMDKLKLSLSYVTNGQKVPSDIQEACVNRFTDLILANTT